MTSTLQILAILWIMNKKLDQKDQKNVYDWLCELLYRSWFKFDPRSAKYSRQGKFIILLIIVLIISSPILIPILIKNIENRLYTANIDDIDIVINHVLNEKNTFDSGEWVDSLGNLAEWRKNPNRILLPSNEERGLLKYTEPIQKNCKYEIIFKPYGKEVINFVIAIPEIYEIVIGDMDYQTVTLKRSIKKGDPPNDPIVESIKKEVRPKLNYKVERESEIRINIEQQILPNKNLWVQLDIQYWSPSINEKLPQTFKYEFKPSPMINDSLYLYIGLIKGKNTAENSVELIKPIISKE